MSAPSTLVLGDVLHYGRFADEITVEDGVEAQLVFSSGIEDIAESWR